MTTENKAMLSRQLVWIVLPLNSTSFCKKHCVIVSLESKINVFIHSFRIYFWNSKQNDNEPILNWNTDEGFVAPA